MIPRDGAAISLWQETADFYIQNNTATNTNYDVIIVGGGITGISLALQLQKSGKKCIVLEANSICFGTSGGTTAHLNTMLDTPYTTIIKNFGEDNAKFVAKAAKESIGLIKSNIESYNISCSFEDVSGYLFAQDEKQEKELEDIFEACGKVEVTASFIDTIPVPIPFTKAMEVPAQGKLSPVEYVYALANAFETAGGVIVQDTRVIGYTQRKDEVANTEVIDVETQSGNYIGNALVYATHIPPGVNIMHFRCAPYRTYVMAVKLSGNDYPTGLIYDMDDPYHYYRTQEINGEKYFIVGGEDHKTAHEENTEKRFHSLEASIRKYFNVEKVTHKWSSQYYEPTDGLPYIGYLPGTSGNIFVATGYGGNGIIYSHVATILLTELITTGKSRYAELFSPNRIKPIAGFSNFIKENADVIKNLIGKWFPVKDLESFSALAHGEGKVVEFDNHKIALYKDVSGNLHAVNPSCTHINCSVLWNAVEQSWDCPCHGARYSIDGKVLNGPAHIDLEKIELKNE
jgi:glycine/D-amino acid oxidase-like deaminating enzyme/nitrite reductase/ring-hydroxylating ferredoxin subunit